MPIPTNAKLSSSISLARIAAFAVVALFPVLGSVLVVLNIIKARSTPYSALDSFQDL